MTLSDEPTAHHRASTGGSPVLARGSSVGRYLLLDLLGEGGMGVVYKAYDPELGRAVALKLLQTDAERSSRLRDRLLREAQALARLQHPNVIAVHDVGTFRADVFIAMEFVEGQTVRAWLKSGPRSRREILDVFLAAGEGLAAAHRAGLIHRDFKPDNVILGDDGRVRVLDFGLARAADSVTADGANANANEDVNANANEDVNVNVTVAGKASSSQTASGDSGRGTSSLLDTPLTHVGAVVGTPRFMAPEQRLDGGVDEAADQFSFCVSLYWALYGAFPFRRIEDAAEGRYEEPPAGATVPRWLKQVLQQGLRSKPADRFPSMGALLGALRDDPAERRRRRLRGALGAIAALALASAAVAGALAWRAQRGAAEQARMAQRFGQEIAEISAIGRYAAYMPLHDTRPELDAIRARMARLKDEMTALGRLAAGPGHYALGRGYVVLERYDQALQELEAAGSTGYQSPDLAYALGLVHGKLYQRALSELRKTGDPARDAAARAAIARAHRDPAVRFLKIARVRGDRLAGSEPPEYAEGLVALYEERWDDALALARQAGARVSWLFEAHGLEGDIHYLRGKERTLNGEVDGALDELRRAGEAYRAVVAVAHSSFAAHLGECRERLEISHLEVDQDRSPGETVERALSACADASQVRPEEPEPLAAQARAWATLANYQMRHGASAAESQDAAIRLGERALTIDPRALAAHQVLGVTECDLADFRLAHGEDPSTLLDQAIGHGRRALEIDPGNLAADGLLLRAFGTRAAYETKRGLDPRPSLSTAAEYGAEEVRRSPGRSMGYNRLGSVQSKLALWEANHGQDPTAALARTEATYNKVVELSPELDFGYTNLCELYLDWGMFQLWQGVSPQERFDRALLRCQEALARDPDDAGSYISLGAIHQNLAAWQLEQHADPTAALERSRQAFEKALKVDSQDVEAHSLLAETRLLEARWRASLGADPRAAFAQAEALAQRGVSLSGGTDSDALRELAEVHLRRAEWRAARKQDVAAEVREGLALTGRSLAQNREHSDTLRTEGELHLLAARSSSGTARTEAAGRASTVLGRALAINANLEHQLRPMLDDAARLAAPPK
jgi:serine/threonine-protein kinase